MGHLTLRRAAPKVMLKTVLNLAAVAAGLSAIVVAYMYQNKMLSFNNQTGLCTVVNCGHKIAMCMTDADCRATMECSRACQDMPRNRQAMCGYICEMTDGYENKVFEDVMLCMIEKDCLPEYPKDGECVAKSDSDAVQTLTSMKQVEGDWWSIRGLNCGYDDDYPGGYDWFPCGHERWTEVKTESGGSRWINNITFCAGSDNKCVSKGGPLGIRTIANVTMPSPGVLRHEYDSALAPQIEKWRVISMPTDDYMLAYWCGNIPIQEYNGGLLFSRKKTSKIPKKIEEQLAADAAKFGMDFYQMCVSDNSWCPDD